MRSRLRYLLLSAAAITVSVSPVWGQTSTPGREVDLAVTYTTERSNVTPGEFFWREGGAVEASTTLYRGLGAAVNIAGLHASDILSGGVDLDSLTTTAGPRYTWQRHKLSLFGQGLFGVSHAWNTLFPEAGGPVSSETSFALQVGGGLDVRVGRRLAIRPLQADWERTRFSNATTGVQNNLRLGAGVVLRLP